MESNYTVYQHTTPSGKVYIGQTCLKPEARWGRDGRGYKKQKFFWSRIQKYGWDNIKHEILLENLTKIEADAVEKALIKLNKELGISLNIADGGEGVSGCKFSEEHKRKIGEAIRGKHWRCSDEARRNMSEAHKGKHPTVETKKKLSDANKGKHHSEEAKKKIGEANKGKQLTEETKKKIGEAKRGKHLSEEHKKKMGESLKGRRFSEETRRKLSEANKGEKNPWYGKHHSDETRKKMSEARIGKKGPLFGKHWYTDGTRSTYAKDCPSGFHPGRVINKNNKKLHK